MIREVKPWYKSKTILFNILGIMLIGAEKNFALLQPYIGDSV